MSEKHLPKHRSAPAPRRTPDRRVRRRAALVTGVAALATGLAVSTGVLTGSSSIDGAASALSLSAASPSSAKGLSQSELADREQRASRSLDRAPQVDRAKKQALSAGSGVAVTRSRDLTKADPKALARALMPQYGISASEFGCLDNLWGSESGWDTHADNPSSSAYGIPQALPGSKMSSAGPNWESNPETQIRWGLGYVKARYGTACSAWSFKQGNNWY
jgi:hypothetical protein